MDAEAGQVQIPYSPDEAAVRDLHSQLVEGWNRGSGVAFAAPFAEDADFVGFDGTYLNGRPEIARFHQQVLDLYVPGSRLVGKVRSVRFLSPDIAVMHAVGGMVPGGQRDLDEERNSIQTIVAVREDSGWKIAAFQNSRAWYIGRPKEAQALTEELRQLL